MAGPASRDGRARSGPVGDARPPDGPASAQAGTSGAPVRLLSMAQLVQLAVYWYGLAPGIGVLHLRQVVAPRERAA